MVYYLWVHKGFSVHAVILQSAVLLGFSGESVSPRTASTKTSLQKPHSSWSRGVRQLYLKLVWLALFIKSRWFFFYWIFTEIRLVRLQTRRKNKQIIIKKKKANRKELLSVNEKHPKTKVRALTVNKWVSGPSVDRGSPMWAPVWLQQQQAAISNKYFCLLGKKSAHFSGLVTEMHHGAISHVGASCQI